MRRSNSIGHLSVIIVFMSIMMLPLLGTLLYSISTSWSSGMLPDGVTFKWYKILFVEHRFLQAMMNSIMVCLGALILTLILVVPTAFIVFYYFPFLKPFMNFIILLPFAVPPVVSSVGLLQIFSNDVITLTGTPWILLGAYFTVALPFSYRAIANNMANLNLQDMLDAAHLLGASTFRAFFTIVLPNLKTGLMISLFLSFSLLIGEFVFANILVGTRFETVQVYLFNMKARSGHFSSAVVVSYFLVIMLMTILAGQWGKKQ
ncbi:ABC transporter permease [Endozoicomonas numazuensis]|uniref:ABC transporter permease n=2 Tax=Endozoicomonas numazuensis TaxID=1137799 RepID=A0A081NIY7_9GAMM|nr:ABC transporter permease [Endozoicomonas numazuensis]